MHKYDTNELNLNKIYTQTMYAWNMLVKKQTHTQQNINIICKYPKSTGMCESLLLKMCEKWKFIEISVPKWMVK